MCNKEVLEASVLNGEVIPSTVIELMYSPLIVEKVIIQMKLILFYDLHYFFTMICGMQTDKLPSLVLYKYTWIELNQSALGKKCRCIVMSF